MKIKLIPPLKILAFLLVLITIILAINSALCVTERAIHPTRYTDIIKTYSKAYGVPEYIVLSIINVESHFKKDALSHAGAIGLMQIMPSTFTWLSSEEHLNEKLDPEELYEPSINIKYGCYYLKYLFEKFQNWDTVFAAYNAGEGNITNWLSSPEHSDGVGGLKDIPFEETRNYVKKVNEEITYYKNTYYKNEVNAR